MPIEGSAGTLDIENATLRSNAIAVLTNLVTGNDRVRESGAPALEVYGDPSNGGNEARLEMVSNTATVSSSAFTRLTSNAGVLSVKTGTDASDNGTITFGGFANERMRIGSDGNVGIGTKLQTRKLHVLGDGQTQYGGVIHATLENPGGTPYESNAFSMNQGGYGHSIRMDLNTLSLNAYGDVGRYGNLKFVVGDGTASGSGQITAMTLQSGGNVGIGTTNPTSHLHIEGTTMQQYKTKEYHYNWGGNNVRRFSIPVTGNTARGSYTVECEANAVAANGSGQKKATFKGYINNYGSGTTVAQVEESLQSYSFHVSHIGTGNSAAGTLRIDYRPDAGFQQNVNTTMFIKVRYAASTSGFGDLAVSDLGSNYSLSGPTWTSSSLSLGKYTYFGNQSSSINFSGSDTKGSLGSKYITALGPGAGVIFMYANYNGYDRTGTQLITYVIGKNVSGGNAIVSRTTQNQHNSSTANFNPYIHMYSASGNTVSLYLYASSGDRSNDGIVDWRVSVFRMQ